MVLDTETLDVEKPLIYDLAFTIIDKKGNVYAQKNWIIKEIFEQKERMQTAYYSKKLPLYDKMLQDGTAVLVPWEQVRTELNGYLHHFDVSVISAYNLAFDKRAITYTNKCLGGKRKFLTKKVELWDIWGIAVQTIFQQKTFHKMALKYNWYSDKGNVITNAEIGYKYITNDIDFIESHTALKDTEIEWKILTRCLKQNKKMENGKGIFPAPWRIAQKNKLK